MEQDPVVRDRVFLDAFRDLVHVVVGYDPVPRHDLHGGLVAHGLYAAAVHGHDNAPDVNSAFIRGLLHRHRDAALGVLHVYDLALVDAGGWIDAFADDADLVRCAHLPDKAHGRGGSDLKRCYKWC